MPPLLAWSVREVARVRSSPEAGQGRDVELAARAVALQPDRPAADLWVKAGNWTLPPARAWTWVKE